MNTDKLCEQVVEKFSVGIRGHDVVLTHDEAYQLAQNLLHALDLLTRWSPV